MHDTIYILCVRVSVSKYICILFFLVFFFFFVTPRAEMGSANVADDQSDV